MINSPLIHGNDMAGNENAISITLVCRANASSIVENAVRCEAFI